MSARLRFAPLHPHPPLARAWWGPWPRRGTVPWWPRVVRPVEIFQCRGCLRWRPWSEGGVPDLRCDHCVLADRRRGLCSQ